MLTARTAEPSVTKVSRDCADEQGGMNPAEVQSKHISTSWPITEDKSNHVHPDGGDFCDLLPPHTCSECQLIPFMCSPHERPRYGLNVNFHSINSFPTPTSRTKVHRQALKLTVRFDLCTR